MGSFTEFSEIYANITLAMENANNEDFYFYCEDDIRSLYRLFDNIQQDGGDFYFTSLNSGTVNVGKLLRCEELLKLFKKFKPSKFKNIPDTFRNFKWRTEQFEKDYFNSCNYAKVVISEKIKKGEKIDPLIIFSDFGKSYNLVHLFKTY